MATPQKRIKKSNKTDKSYDETSHRPGHDATIAAAPESWTWLDAIRIVTGRHEPRTSDEFGKAISKLRRLVKNSDIKEQAAVTSYIALLLLLSGSSRKNREIRHFIGNALGGIVHEFPPHPSVAALTLPVVLRMLKAERDTEMSAKIEILLNRIRQHASTSSLTIEEIERTVSALFSSFPPGVFNELHQESFLNLAIGADNLPTLTGDPEQDAVTLIGEIDEAMAVSRTRINDWLASLEGEHPLLEDARRMVGTIRSVVSRSGYDLLYEGRSIRLSVRRNPKSKFAVFQIETRGTPRECLKGTSFLPKLQIGLADT